MGKENNNVLKCLKIHSSVYYISKQVDESTY